MNLFIDVGTDSDIFVIFFAMNSLLMIAKLIKDCQSEGIAPLLCEAFVSAASFQQLASSVDRKTYF